MRWFRLYAETVSDPKVQLLSGDLFKTWVNILCISCANDGKLPDESSMAYTLHMPLSKLHRHIEALVSAGLLDVEPALHPHNWDTRQHKSDRSNDRVAAFRERQRNVTVTPPDTETEIDKKEPPLVPPSGGRQTRGSRLPADWVPGEVERGFAITLGLDPSSTADKFRDYWTARPGAAGSKLDWLATWRNWCRRESENIPRPRAGPQPAAEAPQMTGSERAEWARKVLATPGRNPGLERTAKQFLETHEARQP